ncbi:MAG: hypothetical protein U5K69_04115 [Balneolaceae bacterium]|nr:hypothetical protein [Balneolaceae bacterium]
MGTALARRAKAFGMQIKYHNRSRVEKETERRNSTQNTCRSWKNLLRHNLMCSAFTAL